MVAAFAALPSTPIFSPVKNVLCTIEGEHLPPGPIEALSWSARYLLRESPERIALLLWARHKAAPTKSLRCLVKQMGWEWRTFQRRRKRAARMICEGLHRDRVPLFDVEWHDVPRRDAAAQQPGLEAPENIG